MKNVIAVVATALAPGIAFAQAIPVPAGSAILPDGRCEAREWADARRVPLAAGAELLAKHAGDFVYLCVKPAAPTWFGVDLHIAREGEAPLNLHASAKLGERMWKDGTWSDFQWWNNTGWVANTSRGVAFEKREFMPDAAKEFQIARSRLGTKPVRLMVELHADSSQASPAGAKAENPAGWFILSLA